MKGMLAGHKWRDLGVLPAAEGLIGWLGSALHSGQGETDGSGAPGSWFILLTNLSAGHLSPQNTDSGLQDRQQWEGRTV